jgi:hypothetical protein
MTSDRDALAGIIRDWCECGTETFAADALLAAGWRPPERPPGAYRVLEVRDDGTVLVEL